jgi:hypothetical protein
MVWNLGLVCVYIQNQNSMFVGFGKGEALILWAVAWNFVKET